MGQIIENANYDVQRRSKPRFNIVDPTLVSVKLGQRNLVPKWVNDFSTTGCQFRMSHFRAHEVGDMINIKIRINGSMILNAQGTVVWKRASTEALNMYDYGVEFNTINKVQDLGKWEKNGFTRRARRRQKLQALRKRRDDVIMKTIITQALVVFTVVASSFAIGFVNSI